MSGRQVSAEWAYAVSTEDKQVMRTSADREERHTFVEMEMRYLENERSGRIRLTQDEIQGYIRSRQEKGLREGSIQNYGFILKNLYHYLPEDKQIDSGTGERWVQYLNEKGYGARTINAHISVLNSFLAYMGRKEWQSSDFCRHLDDIQPELSRTEYKRLLQAAKFLGKERTYLLIKTMGGAGVRVQELPQITVESVREGAIPVECHNRRRNLRIPGVLQKELLDYARRKGIKKGPLFVTREGTPMSRTAVYHCINNISREARVPEEKVNPRCLWKMYQNTYEEIQVHVARIAEQSYERMVEEEQLVLGWEEL